MQRSIPFLWIVVIILLFLNLSVVYSLNQIRLVAIGTLVKVETTLDQLANHEIVYHVQVNQPVPVQAEIPFNQIIDIPLESIFSLPNRQAADIPQNLVIPVEFNDTIHIDTEVQLNTTVPVKVKLAETSLRSYLELAKLYSSQLRSYLMLRGGVPEATLYVDRGGLEQDIEPTHLVVSSVSTPPRSHAAVVDQSDVQPAAPVFVTATPPSAAPEADTQVVVRPIIEPVEPPADVTPPPTSTRMPTQPPGENKATPTPLPTATPNPSPTATNLPPEPTADPYAALRAYVEAVSQWGDQIVLAGEDFKKTVLDFSVGNISLAEFKTEFLAFEPKVRQPIEQIKQIPPPPEAKEAHQKLTSGLDQCTQAMDLMKAWFDNPQTGTKETAAILVFSCVNQVEEAEADLRQLLDR